jgi:pimeloyl-ACP methyl ester carboxylesterase
MIETRRITVEGLTTSVLVGGTGQPGEAVVFVHGNPDSGSDWMPLMTRVAGFARVIAPDLPGFGAADERPDRDYTVYSYARFLDGVIRRFGIDRVHLVAHDFGGPFAAAWAADHPGNVASVTFLNTGVLVGYRWHRMARMWRTPVQGEPGVAEAVGAHHRRAPDAGQDPPGGAAAVPIDPVGGLRSAGGPVA